LGTPSRKAEPWKGGKNTHAPHNWVGNNWGKLPLGMGKEKTPNGKEGSGEEVRRKSISGPKGTKDGKRREERRLATRGGPMTAGGEDGLYINVNSSKTSKTGKRREG